MTMGKKVKQALDSEFSPAKKRERLSQGEILRLIREKNELSQNDLAKAAGLTQATISSLENDRIGMGVERAKVLARVLNVHPAVLVFPDWHNEAA